MKKKTVQTWYAILVLSAILVSVAVVGALGITTLWNKTNRDVVTVMNLTTESKANEMDLVLLKIRDAADTIGAYVGARVASSNQQLDREVISNSLEGEIHELFQSTAEQIDGAVGYYMQFESPYDSLVNSFSLRKNFDADSASPLTKKDDLWVPDESDENREWYALAKAAGAPVWIPIRQNSLSDGYIFSYAVPVYFNDELVGVACVDVDFEVLAELVREVSIYENGYAYLTSESGKVYYHPKIGYGVLLTEDADDVPEVDAALADTSTHGKLISYDYQGQKKQMTFKSLINDMRLVITANTKDIERETNTLIRNIVISSVAILIIIMFLALVLERRMMHPVLDNMDDLAHLDGLTGLQNKASFLERQTVLNKKIRERDADFGFVMIDANNLKRINDEYGHKQGDAYLLTLVEMIQDIFPGDQSYRIGGDEFVVLIEGDQPLHEIEENMNEIGHWQENRRKEEREPWETLSAASAFVRFDPLLHKNAEEVLSEADAKMYQNKQEMKRREGTAVP